MDDSASGLANQASGNAIAHIITARGHLIGRRLPLAGKHSDPAQALAELQAARRELDRAIHVIESWQSTQGM
jgi:hypothetical protein